jgi:hypothetical protein
MPRRIVLLALLVLCSVQSCMPEKFDRKASIAKWFGPLAQGSNWRSFSDDISGKKTLEDIWRQNSRTSIPEPRTEHNPPNSRPGDNQNHSHVPGQPATPPSGHRNPMDSPEKYTLGGLWKLLSMTVDCLFDPVTCQVPDLLRERFSKKWDAWKSKYLDSILKIMHVFSEIPLNILKPFDHFLRWSFDSCPLKTAFVECACLLIFLLLFKNFLLLHANKNKFVSFFWWLLLIVQRLCRVLLLMLGKLQMKTTMTSGDSVAVVCCIVIADCFLNHMLSEAFDENLLMKLTIHEQNIYCRIIKSLLQCNTESCTCLFLVAMAVVFWNKTFLWTHYASRGVKLQGFDTLTVVGALLWVAENGCVIITVCYKMGMFPLLYIALPTDWHGSWTAWGLCMVSLGSVLYTFSSTDILQISFAVLAAAEILIGS